MLAWRRPWARCGRDFADVESAGRGGQTSCPNDALGSPRKCERRALLHSGVGVHQYFTRVADYGFSKTPKRLCGKVGTIKVLYNASQGRFE